MDVALGAAVRIRRRTIGISQEALAEQCGVSFQQIQKYENGANRISFSRLVQIARALKCRVVDLMDVLDGAGQGNHRRPGPLDPHAHARRHRAPGGLRADAAEARSSLVGLLRAVVSQADAPAKSRQIA